jgi:hypothetical protein
MLSIVQDMLDTLSHFRVTLMEEIQSGSDTVALLNQIDVNIHDICDRIFLGFYRVSSVNQTDFLVLAASLRLRFPVPAKFPTPYSSRDTLFHRIAEIRSEAMAKSTFQEENLTLSYAYSNLPPRPSNAALMAGQLGSALEANAGVLQSLFGIETGEEFRIEIR